MIPAPEARDEIFRTFGRAFFREDLDLMFQVVTSDFVWRVAETPGSPVVREVTGRERLAAFFAERRATFEGTRFDDVAYHHAAEATFMTFAMTTTLRASGEAIVGDGVERYTFRGGKIALKDVYIRVRRPT